MYVPETALCCFSLFFLSFVLGAKKVKLIMNENVRNDIIFDEEDFFPDVVRSVVQYFQVEVPDCERIDYDCVTKRLLPVMQEWTETVPNDLVEINTKIADRNQNRRKPNENGVFLHEDLDAVILNIGSSINPLLPELFIAHKVPGEDTTQHIYQGNRVACIAYEPILSVASQIQTAPYLYVVPAAVSSRDGIQQIYQYNEIATSSSLSKATADFFYTSDHDRGDGKKQLVSVHSMKTTVNSIPLHIEIPFLKTDMQGADFESIQSVGSTIRRIPFLLTEVWLHNTQPYYNFKNDLCRDWYPHMISMGYRPAGAIWYPPYKSEDSSVNLTSITNLEFRREFQVDPFTSCATDQENYPQTFVGAVAEADILWVRNDTLLSEETRPPVSKYEEGLMSANWFRNALLAPGFNFEMDKVFSSSSVRLEL